LQPGFSPCVPSARRSMTRQVADAKRQAGQYGSNGLRTDGTSFNVGNKLGERPSIRLFSEYNQGRAMEAILAQADEVPTCDLGRRNFPVEPDPPVAVDSAPATAVGGAVAPAERTLTELDKQWGQQRLLQGIESNRAKDVKAALEDGADVNCADPTTGHTPLHVAAQCGRPRMCELLLELGAAVNVHSKAGELPADVAKTDEIRQLLMVKC